MAGNNKVGILKNIGKLVFQVPQQVDKIEQKLEKVRTCAMCNELRKSCHQKIDTIIELLGERGG